MLRVVSLAYDLIFVLGGFSPRGGVHAAWAGGDASLAVAASVSSPFGSESGVVVVPQVTGRASGNDFSSVPSTNPDSIAHMNSSLASPIRALESRIDVGAGGISSRKNV